jgi:hypothetical protein
MFRHMKVTAYDPIVYNSENSFQLKDGYFCGRSVASLLRFAIPTISNINTHFECEFAVFLYYTEYVI